MNPYQRLKAWQLSHELTIAVYRATRSFPTHEKYGLTSQLRRAAVSVSANIVEGSVKRGPNEFRRYLDIARGSLAEVGYILLLGHDLEYLSADEFRMLDGLHNRTGYLLWHLYRSLRTG